MLATGDLLQHRYRIIRKQGGEASAVYKARDEKTDEVVVIKDVGTASDFTETAQRHLKIKHRALPATKAYFSEGGTNYIVSEYVEGISLLDKIQREGKPLSVANAIEYIKETADAIKYLHLSDFPLIHRDVSPRNILITPYGELKLVDFETSESSDAGAPNNPYLPIELAIHCATPEERKAFEEVVPPSVQEILGREADSRCDIYSLGATLYFLVKGEPPVDSVKRVTSIWSGKKDPLKGLGRKGGAEFTALVRKMLEPARQDRPLSITSIQFELLNKKADIKPVQNLDAFRDSNGIPFSKLVHEGKLLSMKEAIQMTTGNNNESIVTRSSIYKETEHGSVTLSTEVRVSTPSSEKIGKALPDVKKQKVQPPVNETQEEADKLIKVFLFLMAGILGFMLFLYLVFNAGKSDSSSVSKTETSKSSTLDSKDNAYFKKAEGLYQSGDYAAAIEEYRQSIFYYPNYVPAYLKRAYSHHHLFQVAEAHAYYRKAIELDKSLGNRESIKCLLFDPEKDAPQKALNSCHAAITTDTEFSLLFNARAEIFIAMKDATAGSLNFVTALGKNSKDKYLRNRLIAMGKQTTPRDADEAGINAKKAAVFLQKKEYASAQAYYQSAANLKPDVAEYYFGVARAISASGYSASANVPVTFGLELNPGVRDAEIYVIKAMSLHLGSISKSAEAIMYLNKAIEIEPRNFWPYYKKAQIYGQAGNMKQAEESLTKAIQLNPSYADAYYDRYQIFYKNGELDRAIADLKKYLEMKPNNEDAEEELEILEAEKRMSN